MGYTSYSFAFLRLRAMVLLCWDFSSHYKLICFFICVLFCRCMSGARSISVWPPWNHRSALICVPASLLQEQWRTVCLPQHTLSPQDQLALWSQLLHQQSLLLMLLQALLQALLQQAQLRTFLQMVNYVLIKTLWCFWMICNQWN